MLVTAPKWSVITTELWVTTVSRGGVSLNFIFTGFNNQHLVIFLLKFIFWLLETVSGTRSNNYNRNKINEHVSKYRHKRKGWIQELGFSMKNDIEEENYLSLKTETD